MKIIENKVVRMRRKNYKGEMMRGFNAIKALAVFALSGVSCFTLAQEQPVRYIGVDDSLGLLHNVHVNVFDDVDGGCWTNVDAVENRVISKLEQAGVRTYDEHLAFYNGFSALLSVSALGYRDGSSTCIGYLTYDIKKLADTEFNRANDEPFSVKVVGVIYEKGQLLSGGGNLNDRLLSQVDSWTDELIAKIYKGRRQGDVAHLIEAMQDLTEEPLTEVRFQELLEEAMSSE
ncbi:hypothetical protein [Vreelandella titanicae]|uniref:hypothetical protein n=1 Tax=Vreelandella titanicae TaxID=664683 RepID=UPI001144AA51|nr:hypothetical protein [Halomonas titanicae]